LDPGNFYLLINCYLSIFQTNADNDDDVCSVSSAEAGDAPSHSSKSDQRCVGKSLSLPMPKKTDEHFPAPSVRNKILKRKSNSDQVDEAYKFMRTVQEQITQKDAHSVYGENVANRMRDAGRSGHALCIAKNQIDNVLFKLEMGYFDERPSLCSTPDHNSSSYYSSPQSSSVPSPADSFVDNRVFTQFETYYPPSSQPSSATSLPLQHSPTLRTTTGNIPDMEEFLIINSQSAASEK
jgi:hypothetical protein